MTMCPKDHQRESHQRGLLSIACILAILVTQGLAASLQDGMRAAGSESLLPSRELEADPLVGPDHSSQHDVPAADLQTQQQHTTTTRSAAGTARMLQSDEARTATGKFTSITMPLDVCGNSPSMSYSQLAGQVMNSERSLKTYFDQCSFGAMHLKSDPNENLVLTKPIPIRIPSLCNSRTVNCGEGKNELADEAERYASKVLGIDMTKYAVKIFILAPNTLGCPWAGMARWGCFTNSPGPDVPARLCRTWLTSGDTKNMMHEVGHTFGLSHADIGSKDSSDSICPMGTAQGFFCPNAYHSKLLGWTRPLQTLDINDLAGGQWKSVRLPPRVASSSNYLLLTGSGSDLYVSYTAPVGWEADSSDDVAYKLLVHRQKSDADWSRSVSVARLGAQQRTQERGWVVRLAGGASIAGATAQVCRCDSGNQCAEGSEPSGDFSIRPTVKMAASVLRRKSPPPKRKPTVKRASSPPPRRKSPAPKRATPAKKPKASTPPPKRKPTPAPLTRPHRAPAARLPPPQKKVVRPPPKTLVRRSPPLIKKSVLRRPPPLSKRRVGLPRPPPRRVARPRA